MCFCLCVSKWLSWKTGKILHQLEEKHTVPLLTHVNGRQEHWWSSGNIMARWPTYWQEHGHLAEQLLANKEGRRSLTKIIQILGSHPDATTCTCIDKPVKDAITQEALSRIDRMSNETFMAHISSCLEEALRNAGSVVVTSLQICVMDKKETREKKTAQRAIWKVDSMLYDWKELCFANRWWKESSLRSKHS